MILFKSGATMKGKVVIVKPETVEFIETGTELKYEIKRLEIKTITLADGKVLSFENDKDSSSHEVGIMLASITAAVLIVWVIVDIGKSK